MVDSKKLIFQILRAPAIRQSAALASGNILSGVLFGFGMIIASRALGPEKFGIFSVSIALMNILSRGVDLGLNQLMPRLMNFWRADQEKVRSFLQQVLQWKVMLGLLTLLLGLIALPALEELLGYPHRGLLTWAVVGSLFLGVYEYAYLVLTAEHAFGLAAAQNIFHGLVKFIGFAALLIIGLDSLHVFSAVYHFAPLIAALFATKIFSGSIWWVPRRAPKNVREKMFAFVGHSAIGVVAFTMFQNMDVLFVQKFLSPFDTGLYAGATKIAMFITFTATSVTSVLNNRVARYRKRSTLISYLKKSTFFVLISAIGFVLFLPLAKWLLILTIGEEYLPGIATMMLLVFNAFLGLGIAPYVSFFFAVEHPWYFSLGGMLQLGVLLVGNALFLQHGGLLAAAWIKVFTTVIFSLYTLISVAYALRKLELQEKYETHD